MEAISVFDIFKIGVGPSSSHTIGPWRASRLFIRLLKEREAFDRVERVSCDLYGSLAKTGKGHGTDLAVQMGLLYADLRTFPTENLDSTIEHIASQKCICLGGERSLTFDPHSDIRFHFDRTLDFHPNGMTLRAETEDGEVIEETYYSIGGGFVVTEDETPGAHRVVQLPFPTERGQDILDISARTQQSIPEYVRENERVWRTDVEIESGLDELWATMKDCIWRGCNREGILPGGLNVRRRAKAQQRALLGDEEFENQEDWMLAIRKQEPSFEQMLRWISVFALAVNEENAAYGRVVTAPTNGAAGVIPAVMMYAHLFLDFDRNGLHEFLLVAGEIGSLFKKGATISAAMGGCMAEIGVSSSMAAGALAHCQGGSTEQVLMASEIAMEHHLGMTCDPVMGLVQVPCIERNTMGAVKAITASQMALNSDPSAAVVSFDDVVKTMWSTALDMSSKYKETSEGGLALNISVQVPEC